MMENNFLTSDEKTQCGYVAIIGRPNVGKSTLLNRILGQKLSITSPKPQTTRHQILGIKTQNNIQTIYVDTPGLHKGMKSAINRYMNRAASQVLTSVDVICFVVEDLRWTQEDEWILNKIKKIEQPIILVINKIDQIKSKAELLPQLNFLAQKANFAEIIPVSARKKDNIANLEISIAKLLPENPYFFAEDQLTDRSERFLASELIREKLMRILQQEIPYGITVEIEEFKIKKQMLHISAIIWVERDGQKAIIIGANGEQLKNIGQQARLDMEKMFDKKVFLRLWVKVKEGWSDDDRLLQSLGYI